jgi:hypothetical protein
VTWQPTDVVRIAEDLSGARRRALLGAYPLSGPSGDFIVMDAGDRDKLYRHDEELCTWVGRLLPLGLAVREHLQREQP